MGILGWLVRFIVITIIVNLVWRMIVNRRPAGAADGSRSRKGAGAGPRPSGALVRDPHCGTYVMQSRALTTGNGDHAHYFCSDTCRTAWLAAHPQ